jgi:hypothetical protein
LTVKQPWFQPLIKDINPVIRETFLELQQYEQFKKEYTFESLKYGTRLGQSFCNHFNITDHVLFYKPSAESADRYIHKNYIKV